MEQPRLLLAGTASRLEALGLPGGEILDGVAAHAQLDQMQRHAVSSLRATPTITSAS
jgi:hypothetical protein